MMEISRRKRNQSKCHTDKPRHAYTGRRTQLQTHTPADARTHTHTHRQTHTRTHWQIHTPADAHTGRLTGRRTQLQTHTTAGAHTGRQTHAVFTNVYRKCYGVNFCTFAGYAKFQLWYFKNLKHENNLLMRKERIRKTNDNDTSVWFFFL